MGLLRQNPAGSLVALALAIAVGRLVYSPCMRRLFRNVALPGIPEVVDTKYESCSDAELIEKVSLVVTVKDTCAQAEELLTHLSTLFPPSMHVYYAYPNIRGCRHVSAGAAARRVFTNVTEIAVGAADAPIAGFLKVQPLLKTKYAVLMHNDAYPLERQFACDMYRALEAHPEYPIAAPQIYETAAPGVIVPHGHHQNLHVRPSASGQGLRIDYDLSLNLLTQRKPDDFSEGPQVNFLEDHAFFARADKYHELLDPSGSFTLEYMDMILNMRARNTSAWYVPTARCVFDVDTAKITWEDLPYLVYKRSEQIGHQVRTYLSKKWGVEFVNTGIWNYVRYVMLAGVVLEGQSLPEDWQDQAAVFYSWFESVGFNRYDGQMLPQFIEEPPVAGPVKVSRSMKQTLPTDVPEHRVPPMSAPEILPHQAKKKAGAIDLSFKEPHIPIGVKISSCDASQPSSYAICGLAVQDGDKCTCYNYQAPFNLKTTLYLDKIMAWMKLPSRAFMYGQMKYWPLPIDKNEVDMYCEKTQEDCAFEVEFSANARVLQWSWFGKQSSWCPWTPEGMAIFSIIMLLVLAPVMLTSNRVQEWMGVKKQQLRSLAALNRLICNHAVRS
mmetsp:Transcript_99978/g.214154  ORF Transcript_99978/g.214154 Transcript_99978/m.214154 type:complete len:610 (+) Transcript_99978:110-1939(+)